MQHTPDDLVEVRHAANYFSALRSCSSVREDEEHLSREVCGERLREVVSSSLTGQPVHPADLSIGGIFVAKLPIDSVVYQRNLAELLDIDAHVC